MPELADSTTPLAWERQRGESRQAFEAFTRYRDMGPARSTAKVARELGKSKTLCDRWSAKWNWVPRTDAFDVEQDAATRRELHAARLETRRRHLRVADLMLNRVVAALQAVDPAKIPPQALPHMLRAAADAQRAALGDDDVPVVDESARAILAAVRSVAMERRGHA